MRSVSGSFDFSDAASSGESNSGAAPRWTIAGLSSRAYFSIMARSAVRNSADTLDGESTAAATAAAESTKSSRGNSPLPTRMPM